MTRVISRLAVLLAAFLAITASAMAQGPPKLTNGQRAEKIKALPDDERTWLADYVAPIILPEEVNLFLQLTEPHQREAFKADFWKRREKEGLPLPLGPGYEHRYAHLREVAATEYDGINRDAGRMVLLYGEPASVEDLTDCDVFRQAQIWTYQRPGGPDSTIRHIFYRPTWGGLRKLWLPGDTGIFQTSSCVQGNNASNDFDVACQAASKGAGDLPCQSTNPLQQRNAVPKRCEVSCDVARVAHSIDARGSTAESAYLSQGFPISTEGLDGLWQRFASSAQPGARTISGNPAGAAVPAGNPQSAPPPPGTPAVAAAPAKPAKAPSKSELLKALPDEERQWLTEYVGAIILPQEEKIFLELTEPHERERFKREFWARRERDDLKPPLGPGYQARYEELRRVADEVYDGWRNDAGRMVLRFGEPADIKKLDFCGGVFRDLEIWTYANTGQFSNTVRHFFYRPQPLTPRRLWMVGTNSSDIFVPGSCRKRFEDLFLDCPEAPAQAQAADPCRGSSGCGDACEVYHVWQQIQSRQGSALGGLTESARLFDPQEVSLEGVESIKSMSANAVDPKAKTLGVTGPGGSAPAGSSAAAGQAQGAVKHKLTSKEIKALTAKLDQKYRDFLELVEMIIADEERQVFLLINENYQKDSFIEAFWKRRSIDSSGIRTDYREVHTQRVEQAKQQFRSLNNDRAKLFIISGPPDAVVPIDCPDVLVPLQIWYYERLEALKTKVYLIFYQPYGVGDYRLWLPLDGMNVLTPGGGGPGGRRVDPSRCFDYRTVQQAIAAEQAALGSGPMAMLGAAKLFQPPVVETEGIDHVLNMTTDAVAGAVPIAITKLVRFPELRVNKIAVDLSLLLPKSELKARELGEERFYNVDVIGEVVKDQRLIDNFKYRFDIPVDEVRSDQIPVTVRRYLYPGEYKLVLKIADGNQNAEAHLTEQLTVPEQPDAPPPTLAAAREEGRSTIKKAPEFTSLLPSAISILPIAKELATGLQRFETRTAEGIRAVDFFLNGNKVMTRTRPPFDADLNLGPLPRKHTIRVVAYGPDGRTVGEDEYTVNEGKEVFRVRVLSPEKGSKVSGPVKVVAALAVPEGKTLQKLEIYSNETRVATLYQAPFEQTVNIKDTKSLGYVRVVGTLDDGTVAEDLRYVNAPDYISEVTVDAVELYATVTDKGRPVSSLQQTSFKVFEDGVVQKIEAFDYVKNLPLTVGVALDTSASMLESLPEVQKAATAFLDSTIGAKDRAFTLSFDNEPYVLCKLTNRKDKLFRSLGGLRAEGSTALYDAIVYSLYQFSGVKGKKALVLLTDGKDTASKFEFETMLEYVKKSGISVYAIGFKIGGADLEVKYKLNKIAQFTGGQTFYVDNANHLDAIYKQINEELRSQYFLTYYSTNTSGSKDKWRKVEIKVEPTNLQARAISGYYP